MKQKYSQDLRRVSEFSKILLKYYFSDNDSLHASLLTHSYLLDVKTSSCCELCNTKLSIYRVLFQCPRY